MGSIRLDDLNWERGGYNRWRAYGQAKLANLLFASELQRRLEVAGSTLGAHAAHPGWAATARRSEPASLRRRWSSSVNRRFESFDCPYARQRR